MVGRLLRRLNPEIVIGFLVATVFWIGILGWQSAYAPTEIEKQRCQEAAEQAGRKSEECKSLWEKTTTDPVAFFTLVLAISTVGLWVATIALYRAGERQLEFLRESSAAQSSDMQESITAAQRSADIAERSLVILQRALIVPARFQVDVLVRNHQIIGHYITAMFENTGNTPAKHVTGQANFVMWDGPFPRDFKYPDRSPTGEPTGLVGPRVPMPYPIAVAIQDFDDIAAKKKKGFMYGWVEYDDVFGIKRRTEFCVEVEVVGSPRPPLNIEPGKASFLAFGHNGSLYNGIDEDCMYKPGERPPIGGLPPPTQPPPENPLSI